MKTDKTGLIAAILYFLSGLVSCDLDYADTQTIDPANVWTDKKMVYAFLSDIYGNAMPVWPGSSYDESIGGNGANLSDYLRGIISVEKTGVGFDYSNIDKANFFLDKLSRMSSSVMPETEKKQLEGQALFWRAWSYWNMVAYLGGVPLILKPQDVNNKPSLFVPRNKTSECVHQIITDLDEAIDVLPDKWEDHNYGRIDKGMAMAFKGRVLLYYASPLFNPSHDPLRWLEAYEANKQAVEHLRTMGKELLSDYGDIWLREQNHEVVMVNQYYYPDHTFNQSWIRPEAFSKGNANNHQPILPLLGAFPRRDGASMQPDTIRLHDSAYNAQYLDDFLNNRDDRFYTTIFFGGTRYPSTDVVFDQAESYWCVWKKNINAPSGVNQYESLVGVQIQSNGNFGCSGFYQLKGLDRNINKGTVGFATTDWVEIRFAEVLMNLGECANETGNTGEALQVLYDIRKRAGILPGDGKYGITADTQEEIREAYINERFVEFAFEGKRSGDLRRWKRFDILNKQKYRSGLYITLNDSLTVEQREDFDWTGKITNNEVKKNFHVEYIRNLDRDDQYRYQLDLNHWFFPIAKKDLDSNSKLEQNNEWGGTFDPLL